VGVVTAGKLHRHGIVRVAQVAEMPEAALIAIVGRAAGRHLHAMACNVDPRPVEGGRRRHSIGSQRALGSGERPIAAIDTILIGLVDRVTRRMRTAQRAGRTVVIRLRFADYTRATRSHTLPQATAQTRPILAVARALLQRGRPMIEGKGLTLIGVAVGNLERMDAVQLALPFDRRGSAALDAVIDEVRARFGVSAISRAVALGQREDVSVPLLPD
jgi:DNA polymerase-4